MNTRTALLGTGTMGTGMARSIAAAGLPLTVWNRTRERAEPLGDVATVADDAASAVADADVVVTMLYDAESVARTMQDAADSLAEGAVWVQTSTVGVPGEQRLQDLAREIGVAYVDAPVLGTKKPADDGALVVLASGEDSLEERVAPVLDAIGSRTMWLGPAGAGSRLKLACNAWVATVVQGVAESLAMAEALGVDPNLFLEAVGGGALDAPYVQLKGGAMLEGDTTPSFALDGVVKDLDLMLEATRDTAYSADLVAAVRRRFVTASEQGHGAEDMSATYVSTRG